MNQKTACPKYPVIWPIWTILPEFNHASKGAPIVTRESEGCLCDSYGCPWITVQPLGKALHPFLPFLLKWHTWLRGSCWSHMDGLEQGQLLRETPVLCQGVHFILISPTCRKVRDNPSSWTVWFTLNLSPCFLPNSVWEPGKVKELLLRYPWFCSCSLWRKEQAVFVWKKDLFVLLVCALRCSCQYEFHLTF